MNKELLIKKRKVTLADVFKKEFLFFIFWWQNWWWLFWGQPKVVKSFIALAPVTDQKHKIINSEKRDSTYSACVVILQVFLLKRDFIVTSWGNSYCFKGNNTCTQMEDFILTKIIISVPVPHIRLIPCYNRSSFISHTRIYRLFSSLLLSFSIVQFLTNYDVTNRKL